MMRRGFFVWRLALAIVAALTAFPGAAVAELRGLVIGINDYAHLEKLDGAVNDARDVDDALRSVGASDVLMLLDGQATRDAILRSWAAMVERSKPGDILVLHYAGHGGQSPERVRGSEATGKDSELLLGGFTPQAPGNYERIVDDEINGMLSSAPTDRVIILVTDACHSGTMTRSFGGQNRRKVRAAVHGPIVNDQLPPPDPALARMQLADLPHVAALGAVQDGQLAPEVMLDDSVRGALSWSFAKSIRGTADLNADGVVRGDELVAYMRKSIHIVTDGQQQPSLPPTELDDADYSKTRSGGGIVGGVSKFLLDKILVPYIGEKSLDYAYDQGLKLFKKNLYDQAYGMPDELPSINVYIDGVDSSSVKFFQSLAVKQSGGPLDGVVFVESDKQAHLVWDSSKGLITHGTDHVANVRGTAGPDQSLTRAFGRAGGNSPQSASVDKLVAEWPVVRGIIDKWRLVYTLQKYALEKNQAVNSSLRMRLSPSNSVHRKGRQVTLTIEGIQYPHMMLVDVTSGGAILLLYPQSGGSYRDDPKVLISRPFELPLVVEPPYGSDHFVAVFAEQSMEELLDKLRSQAALTSVQGFYNLLKEHVSGRPHQMHYLGVYTQE